MKYLGKVTDPKDLCTKEYADKKVANGIGATAERSVQLNEDTTRTTINTFTLSNPQTEYDGLSFNSGVGTDPYPAIYPPQSAVLDGKYATTMNEASFACGRNAFAHGHNCVAHGDCSEAGGESTVAAGGNSRAMGRYTLASGFNSLAEGWKSIASGNNSRAGGYNNEAAGSRSYANGVNTVAYGENSFTSGEGNIVGIKGFKSILHGKSTLYFVLDSVTGISVGDKFSACNAATGKSWLNVGTVTAIDTPNLKITVSSWGDMSYASTSTEAYVFFIDKPKIGTHILNSDINGVDNYGFNSAVFGKNNVVIGQRAFSNGFDCQALSNNSFTSGYKNIASGAGAMANGNTSVASGGYSFTSGYHTTASGDYSHAEGIETSASATSSHAEGERTTASGDCSHAEGYNTTASGQYSHAEGCETSTSASNYASHAEGYGTRASGDCSHAEGSATTASGDCSHAEGSATTASGSYSHAEGSTTTASGQYSHAEGWGTSTSASNYASHAEGYGTRASGDCSHAEGRSTTASGKFSHAEGYNTTAQRQSQHVSGEYNVLDTGGSGTTTRGNYALIVGNGTGTSARSNALALGWSGNLKLNGNVYVECNADSTGGTKLATESYVDNHHDSSKADASALTSHTSDTEVHHTITLGESVGEEIEITVDGIDSMPLQAKYDYNGNKIDETYADVVRVTAIEGKIPSQASSSNQLADKSFVNSSISTNTAYFRGTSASGLTEAQFLAWANGLTKTNNDYVFWNTTDSDGNVVYKRYKYNGSAWVFEFALNNSSFTASQWASVNSGITSSDVSAIASNTSARHTHSNKTVLDGISSTNISTWNGKQDAISDLATIRSNASSGASKVSCTDATVGGFGYTKNSGTVTSVAVKMNGATKGTVTTSGTIDLGTVITAHQDISGKEDKGKVTISSTQYNVGSVDLVVTFDDSTTTTYHLLVRS